MQDLSYQWDLNSNLHQRLDQRQGLTEVFVNDAMNRLTSSTLNGVPNLTVGYDAAGNITGRSDTGSYDYSTAQPGCSYYAHSQPHAVRKAVGRMVPEHLIIRAACRLRPGGAHRDVRYDAPGRARGQAA